ncbi:toxin YdaT family protein [Escherichia coli]|uniref:toxin YdaT family protein n=1 Tax=Escherichia coli TaxID=562 RepID=UPI00031002EC
MTFPELYDDSHPEALARNTQKIFRWWRKTPLMLLKKIQALLPAIEKGNAASAGGPYAQSQLRLFSGVGRDEGTAGERY